MINWYDRARLGDNDLTQEAGVKENFISSVLGALVMLLSGSALENAAEHYKLNKQVIERAAKDPRLVGRAREMLDSGDMINAPISGMIPSRGLMPPWQYPQGGDVGPTRADMPLDLEGTVKSVREGFEKRRQEETKRQHAPAQVTKAMVDVVTSLEHDPRRQVSSKGATGVMQIMGPTWEEINRKHFGGKYPYRQYARNKGVNKAFGEIHLKNIKDYLDQHRSEWKTDQASLILACYHGGIGNVTLAKFDREIIRRKMPATYDYMVRGTNLLEDVGR